MENENKKIEAEILENSDNKEIKKTENENDKKIKENKTRYEFKQIPNKKKNGRFIIFTAIIVLLLIIGALLSTIFALLNASNNTVLSGIYVNNILIEGLTEQEAINLLNEKFESEKKKEIILVINGESFSLTPEQIEVKYNLEDAVKEAYSVGRNGNIFENNYEILFSMLEEKNIEVEITYNEELLETVLEGFGAKLPNAMADNTYCIEDNELIITKGTDGVTIDVEEAKSVIIDNIKKLSNEKIELKTKYTKCPEIDIEKIYLEVKAEPQNASYTTDPFEIIPHKYGIDFDIEEAKSILKEEKNEYVISLTLIEPEILTNEIGEEAFPDLLSSFSTKYDETNVSRSNNLKIAVSKLNGVVVMPGEIFSYNQTLGKRTAEQGYEYANGFAGGKVVPMLAGGICQISSTLYDAVLYANLNIVERHNHAFQATYVEPGKDATVVYGSLDFKFENTRSYPIMLKATASGGLAEIKVFGIKEEVEYEVQIISEILSYTPYSVVYEEDSSLASGKEKVSQWGLQGCKSITYRVLRLNGQEVSKEVLSTDTYKALNKIIKRGPEKATVNTSTTPDNNETQTSNKESLTDTNETNNKETSTNTTSNNEVSNDTNTVNNNETQTNSNTVNNNGVSTNTNTVSKEETNTTNEAN